MALNHGTARAAGMRSKELALLLGIREAEAADRSLSARLKIIAKLKAARRVEIARGRAGSWLYDVNRHLNLCTALRLDTSPWLPISPGMQARTAALNRRVLAPIRRRSLYGPECRARGKPLCAPRGQ